MYLFLIKGSQRKLEPTQPRQPATILCDYNFAMTTAVDDSFQFIDCFQVEFDKLAREIRNGVIEIEHKKVIVAIGNQAALDNFTNVVNPVNLIINALIDRYGCLQVEIWVLSLLPCPGVPQGVTEILQKQNKSIGKAIAALIQRRRFPVQFVPSHKCFLKRVQNGDGKLQVEVDNMYYYQGTIHLNQHGLEHFYLLLVQELQLWDVKYEWTEMPIVVKRGLKRKVLQQLQSDPQ